MSDDPNHSKDVSGPQDPHVARNRPLPDQPPQAGLSLVGFLGDSDRPGHRRLYFTTKLDYYVEFKIEDALAAESIPPERAPFPGMEATKLTLRKDAVLSYTRTRRAGPPDEFDIDMRRLPRRGYRRLNPMAYATDPAGDPPCTQWGGCGEGVSDAGTCPTCGGATCGGTCDDTCLNYTCNCGQTQFTCFNTCEKTCMCTEGGDACYDPGPSDIQTACNTCYVVCP